MKLWVTYNPYYVNNSGIANILIHFSTTTACSCEVSDKHLKIQILTMLKSKITEFWVVWYIELFNWHIKLLFSVPKTIFKDLFFLIYRLCALRQEKIIVTCFLITRTYYMVLKIIYL